MDAVALDFGYAAGSPPALYFHCATAGRKLDLIRANPQVAFIIDRALELVRGAKACDWGMKYESVMGSGKVGLVSDPEERRGGLDFILAQYGGAALPYSEELLARTVVLKLVVQEMSGKRKA